MQKNVILDFVECKIKINMNGFIKLHRKLLDWEWYNDANVFRVFMHLLLKANFKDKNWQGKTIKRGQIIIGLSKFGSELSLSTQQVRTSLNKLKSTKEITSKATSKYTLVTIVNFEVYQKKEDQDNKQNNTQITNEQQTNNKQITNEQQQRKNDKNIKKEKNDKNYISETSSQESKNSSDNSNPSSKRFKPPTIVDIENYCTEKGWKTSFAQVFFDGNEQSGWKLSNGRVMKNWKAACRTWMNKEYNSKYIDNSSNIHNQAIKTDDSNNLDLSKLSEQKRAKYFTTLAKALRRFLKNPNITQQQKDGYVFLSSKDFADKFKTDHPKIFSQCLSEYQEKILNHLQG